MAGSGSAQPLDLVLTSRTIVKGLMTVEVTINTEKMAASRTGICLHNSTNTSRNRKISKTTYIYIYIYIYFYSVS